MTACQKTETEGSASGEVTVSVAASLPAEMAETRANGDGGSINRCIMEIYLDGQLYGERKTADVDGLKASFTVRLLAGKSYDFVFWADHADTDGSDLHYNTGNLPTVTIADIDTYTGNDETRDAFFGATTLTANFSATLDVELRRPFGQLNVNTLDMADIPADMQPATATVAFESIPAGIDLLTGELTADSKEVEYTADIADSNTGLLMFDYIFAPAGADEQFLTNFSMAFTRKDGTAIDAPYDFSSIPVQRNYRTNVSGYLFTRQADITVEINPAFDGDITPWDGVSTKEVTPVSKEVDGTTRNVYIISEPAEFAWVAAQLQAKNPAVKYMELADDIDLGGHKVAITALISGIHFDGRNYAIKNYAVETDTQAAGLFCDVATATVRNLTLENAHVTAINDGGGNAYAGALMGRTYGTIVVENVHVVNPTIEGVNKVGGLVGFVAENNITATGCSVEGGSVSTTFVEGESGQIGGFIGYLGSLYGTTCTITDCHVANTTVNAHMTRADRTISKFIGCFQGNQATDVLTIDNCSVENVTLNPLDDMAASYFSPYGDLLGGQRVGLGTVNITNSETAIVLSTPAHLVAFAEAANANKGADFANKTVKLDADIDLAGIEWIPANCFSASKFVFDGQGHTIKNMNVVQNNAYGNGFFSNIVSGTVKNITFDNARVSKTAENPYSGNCYGIVSGYTYGSVLFENVHVKNSNIYGYGKVGGIIGMAADKGGTTVITGCSVKETNIAAAYNAGGIIGLAQNAVELNNAVTENVTWAQAPDETYADLDETGYDVDNNPVTVKGTYMVYQEWRYAAWGDYYTDYYYADREVKLSNETFLADGLCHNRE